MMPQPLNSVMNSQIAKEARQRALAELDKNLDTEALLILAEKSKKPGISEKLKKFQSFI